MNKVLDASVAINQGHTDKGADAQLVEIVLDEVGGLSHTPLS